MIWQQAGEIPGRAAPAGAASVLARRRQGYAPVLACPGVAMKVTASGVVPVRRGRVLAGGPVRRRGVPLVLTAAAVVACAGLLIGTGVASAAADARGAVLRVHWGRAAEVPGLGTLNVGGNAQVLSVSCWRAGRCAAGGFYTDASQHQQAFVVDETNGRWREAEEVPGSAELNAGGGAQVLSVSCPPGGECAGGRLLLRQRREPAGLRGKREERPVAQGRGDTGHGELETQAGLPGCVGVVPVGGQLRHRRLVPEPPAAARQRLQLI